MAAGSPLKKSFRLPVAALAVVQWLVSCTRSDDPDPTVQAVIRFTDVSTTTGADLVLTCGGTPSSQILEVKGCGVALIDFDNDGDLDVFVPNGATLENPAEGPGCRLFENQGAFRFRDVTSASGLAHRRWSFGVAAGDYDGDGLDDLYVACYGPNALLRNLGGGRFADVTERSGVGDAGWSTGCAFGDVDGDGDIDLYVANYLRFDAARPPPPVTYQGVEVLSGPHGLQPSADVLYENLGNGTFRDRTRASGCGDVKAAYGLNVVILDFDRDGRQEIYVANDSMANFFFHRGDDGRFEDRGLASGVCCNVDGTHQATMGIAVGDVDGNGYPDLFTTNFSSDLNTLHLNLDGTFFEERTRQYGLGGVSWSFVGWACAFYDFEHDGDEDLLVVNGHVFPQATRESMDSDYEQPPLLFERRRERFHRLEGGTAGSWLDEPHRDRTAAFGDLDGDGDIDALIGELNGPLRFLRNDSRRPAGAGWLIVGLRDEGAPRNRRGLGSRIELISKGARQRRWIYGGGPFQSVSAPYAHFGLPSVAAPLVLEITWPDGARQVVKEVTPNQRITVTRADE